MMTLNQFLKLVKDSHKNIRSEVVDKKGQVYYTDSNFLEIEIEGDYIGLQDFHISPDSQKLVSMYLGSHNPDKAIEIISRFVERNKKSKKGK